MLAILSLLPVVRGATSPKHIVLWACGTQSSWEYDYFVELFPLSHFNHVFLKVTPVTDDVHPKVLVYNVENAGSDGSYSLIRKLIATHKIPILVHTSDEYMGNPKKWKYGEGVEMYPLVPFVLRQYSVHVYQEYARPYSNVMQIPLGYMAGMLRNKHADGTVGEPVLSTDAISWSNKKLSADRNVSWSFLGAIRNHHDRVKMIDTFSSWLPHIADVGFSPQEMKNVYNSSKFVLIGRGQASLDCFRIYEAIICGAIPVIVGPQWELGSVFEFEGDSPPFLFANEYAEALETCRTMSDAQIDAQRQAITSWYIDRIELIKRRIIYYSNKYFK